MTVDADALTSLDDLKEYIGLTTGDHDLLLENLIDRATDLFETYCDRKFAAAAYTEYHDGRGLDKLFPKQWPVNSVTSIHDDSDWTWGADTLIDAGDYRIAHDGYIQMKTSTFSDDVQNVKIVYNGGYSTIPEDLAQACIEQAAWMFKQSPEGSALLGVSAKSFPDGSVSYTTRDLLSQVTLVLEKYRRRNLA